MDGKRLLAGLLLGVGLGAVLGVMYAPRSGSATREKLAERTAKLKERMRSAPLVFIIPIAFQYQHQDQIQHHYARGDEQPQ